MVGLLDEGVTPRLMRFAGSSRSDSSSAAPTPGADTGTDSPTLQRRRDGRDRGKHARADEIAAEIVVAEMLERTQKDREIIGELTLDAERSPSSSALRCARNSPLLYVSPNVIAHLERRGQGELERA